MSLKFGVVGTNFISDAFIEAAKGMPGVEISAVYSRKIDTGSHFAEKHSIKKVYCDYGKMLEDNDVSAVYIASPIFMHKEQAILAMRKGRHVLCEKAIAVNSEEFLQMKQAAEESGVVLLEAMRPLHDPFFSLLKKTLEALGKVREARLEFCQYSRRYDKFKAGILSNAFDPQIKNSALTDIGIYPLNLAHALFGEPRELSATSKFLHNGFEGEGELLLGYDGFDVHIAYSKIRQGENLSYIKCDGGALRFDKPNAPDLVELTDNFGAETRLDYRPPKNNMVYEIAAFCDMVTGVASEKPYLSITEATMRTVDRIYKETGISFPCNKNPSI